MIYLLCTFWSGFSEIVNEIFLSSMLVYLRVCAESSYSWSCIPCLAGCVLIGIFTCLFRLTLIYFPLLRIVGITTCICECLSYSKLSMPSANDIHAHNCICATDILYSLAQLLCAYIEKCSCCSLAFSFSENLFFSLMNG
jgi:hypothetical protein